MPHAILTVDGAVGRQCAFTRGDLAAIDSTQQVADMSQVDPQRQGAAVRLSAVLALADPKPEAVYLTLHASADDFHASMPLEAVRERGLLIYQLGDGPLPASAGGPVRFFIPDFAACHSAEVDECANVKFVDRLELSAERGHDNRPQDDQSHQDLHARQDG